MKHSSCTARMPNSVGVSPTQGKKRCVPKNVYVEHEYGPSVDRSSFFYEYHMARGHLLLELEDVDSSV